MSTRRVFSAILVGAILAATLSWPAQAATLEAGSGQKYPGLKAALAAATPGDEIRLHAGRYAEGPLLIDKPLTLSGVGRPVLDGRNQDPILTVRAPHVTIQGLRLENPGSSSMKDLAGLRLENLSDCRVIDNQLDNAYFGIYLANVNRCVVSGNTVTGRAVRESTSGNAIHAWKSNALTISDNTLSGHRDGIYLEFTRNSRIEKNHSHHNLRYGLHFMFSHGNGYYTNLFSENGAGVAVMYTHQIEMIGNRFVHNWGPSAYGLLLKDISGASIRANLFERNTVAMHIEGSSRLTVRGNTFRQNGWAARVLSNSYDNRFLANGFFGNTFDIASNAADTSQSINAFAGNYWDKYSGYDLDRDGVGDVPHHPVSLFSRLVENIPAATMLMRSFLVTTLDLAERVSPVLTPKTMVDKAPLMRRPS